MSELPKGGFIHRMMPPTDWACGEIPDSCYEGDKGRGEIRKILEESYLKQESVDRLVVWLNERDGEENHHHELIAKMQLEMLAEIDADTVWRNNQ